MQNIITTPFGAKKLPADFVLAADRCAREAAPTSTSVHPSRLVLSPASSQKRGIVARTSAAATPLPFTPRRLRGPIMNRLATEDRPARRSIGCLSGGGGGGAPRTEGIIGAVGLARFSRTDGGGRTRGRPGAICCFASASPADVLSERLSLSDIASSPN